MNMTMTQKHEASLSMSVRAALQVLVGHRQDHHIVITNQGSARIWPRLAPPGVDFHYNPSAMGGAVSLALGIALARPDHEVIVVTGDGALLMNLGCLVSVIAAHVSNLTIVVLDNGIYEVTGGQQTAAAQADVDYAKLATSVGFSNTQSFRDLAVWQVGLPEMLAQPGPRLACLQVTRAEPADLTVPPFSMREQLVRFRQQLAVRQYQKSLYPEQARW